jgi:hypothetical protein
MMMMMMMIAAERITAQYQIQNDDDDPECILAYASCRREATDSVPACLAFKRRS